MSTDDALEFTTVVGIDVRHLEELKLVWPSWRRYRPEILYRPMLLICDAILSEAEWAERLRFVDHPRKRLTLWDVSGVSQREKMLSAFVFVPGREVETPWFLKLDTDLIAKDSRGWLQSEWFCPDGRGRIPVFISPPSHVYDTENNALLDNWGDGVPGLLELTRLDELPAPTKLRIQNTRIMSWSFFGRTEWCRQIAGFAGNRLPVPSHDTFAWYCATRRGDLFRRVEIESFIHCRSRRRKLIRHAEFLNRSEGYIGPLFTSPLDAPQQTGDSNADNSNHISDPRSWTIATGSHAQQNKSSEGLMAFVLPTYRDYSYAQRAARTFFDYTKNPFLIVIDDAFPACPFRDSHQVWFEGMPLDRIYVLCRDENRGLTASWNDGLEIAQQIGAEFAIAGNSDVVFTPNWSDGIVRAIDEGFDLVGPITNAPGHLNEGKQDVRKYVPGYELTDESAYLTSVAAYVRAHYGDMPAVASRINGFFMFARTERWWSGSFDSHHVFNPANRMIHNERELQERWRKDGTKTGFSRSSFIFHYRSVTRGHRFRTKGWFRPKSKN
jgi:GT2 family glycosyltransferase